MALALAGAGIATHLALYQLRLVERVWEPFFEMGSPVILNSIVSGVLPIPDAALGACVYLLQALTGLIGGRRRWRTRPWIVLAFGLAVGPLGAFGVLLLILPPVVLGAWCTLCLASAAASILMIGPAMDEVLAALQHVRREWLEGSSAWRVFWGMRERRRDWLEGADQDQDEADEAQHEALRVAALAKHGERRRPSRHVAREHGLARTRPAEGDLGAIEASARERERRPAEPGAREPERL